MGKTGGDPGTLDMREESMTRGQVTQRGPEKAGNNH